MANPYYKPIQYKVKTYKSCKIHYVYGTYKYDIYDNEDRWCTSVNSIKEAKQCITNLLWTRANVPL